VQFLACNEEKCPSGPLHCASLLDVILVVDASGSLTEVGFAALKSLAQELGSAYTARKNTTSVGLISFSEQALRLAPLTLDNTVFAEGLGKLSWLRGPTDLSVGLSTAASAMLAGGRRDVPTTVVVLTDGRLSDLYKATEAAKRLKDGAVRVVVVPVRSNFDTTSLAGLVSVPAKDNLLPVSGGVSYLKKNVKEVARKIVVDTCSLVVPGDQ
jgi:Mg-chelatase subunit ChlD